jgi:hypothetical protein
MTEYVIVTAVSSHRMRYCIPVDELKKLNQEVDPTVDDLHEWARDCVTMEQVKEFSQHWLGETIIDSVLLNEDRMLEQFDLDNDYLNSWSKEKKIGYVSEWKDKG